MTPFLSKVSRVSYIAKPQTDSFSMGSKDSLAKSPFATRIVPVGVVTGGLVVVLVGGCVAVVLVGGFVVVVLVGGGAVVVVVVVSSAQLGRIRAIAITRINGIRNSFLIFTS